MVQNKRRLLLTHCRIHGQHDFRGVNRDKHNSLCLLYQEIPLLERGGRVQLPKCFDVTTGDEEKLLAWAEMTQDGRFVVEDQEPTFKESRCVSLASIFAMYHSVVSTACFLLASYFALI